MGGSVLAGLSGRVHPRSIRPSRHVQRHQSFCRGDIGTYTRKQIIVSCHRLRCELRPADGGEVLLAKGQK